MSIDNISTAHSDLGDAEKYIHEAAQTDEVKARRRFVAKFYKHKTPEPEPQSLSDNDQSPVWPWYKFKRKHVPRKPFTPRNQLNATIFSSWINVLLLLVPVGFVLNYIKTNPIAVFVVNFIAVIPIAGLVGIATDDFRRRVGDNMGVLIYMTFGNLVQVITSALLLRSRQIAILKTSLLGGILTLVLLVNGIAFFFGGLRRREQFFNITASTVLSNLLSVAVAALIIPTASWYLSATPTPMITAQSRGTSVVLLLIYGLHLYFEFFTHNDGYQEESKKVPMRPRMNALPDGAIAKAFAKGRGVGAGPGRPLMDVRPSQDELLFQSAYENEDDLRKEPELHSVVCLAILAVGTTLLAFNTKFMTDSIDGLVQKHVPRDFIGLVLLPILSSDTVAIQSAVKDEMDIAIQSAIGRSVQTALVVTPVLVLIGWVMGVDDMNLLFDGFQVSALFVSVLLAQRCISQAKSDWLSGAILALTYVIVAIASWFQGQQSVVAGTNPTYHTRHFPP